MAESASADIGIVQLTATTYQYSISLTDTGTTQIGTFWFSWVPGEGFLSEVSTFSSPAGWSASITDGVPPANGYSILWSASSALLPGQTLSGFRFTSTMTPAELFGSSTIHPPTPATTSTIYSGGIFSDAGFSFAADPAIIMGTAGNDTLIGTSLADTFDIGQGGTDIVKGADGNDVIKAGAAFDARDKLDGGAGVDELDLAGDYSAGLTMHSLTLRHVESIVLDAGFGYAITTNDGNVAAGARLTVDGQSLGAADVVRFNGSSETDGLLTLRGGAAGDLLRGGNMKDQLSGGAGADKLFGGAEADILTGGRGADDLYGGVGNDRFVFANVAESTVAGADWIRDWNTGDRIDLSAIDANTGVAGNQAFAFIGSAGFSAAGQLQVVTSGSNTIIRGDINGDGAADLMIKLVGDPGLGSHSFIL